MERFHQTPDSTRNIRATFFLNLGFTILEVIGGFWTNSMAIFSDALHDLGDSFSLGLSWYLDKYSKKGMDKRYSFGYRRFSLVGAFANGLVIITGSLVIFSETIPRLFHPEFADAKGMLLFAVAGITINGLAVLRVRGGKSLNVKMVAWHLLEDVMGWSAILVVSIVLLFKEIPILDPILSILITLYVLYNVARNLRKTSMVFLQAVPEDIDIGSIEKKLQTVEGVRSIHHTQIWSLDGEHHVLSTHVVVDENSTKEEVTQVKCEINELTNQLGFEHITVEIEYEHEECRIKTVEKSDG
jgi:cobalt-zinc-cadmium efflux system protein